VCNRHETGPDDVTVLCISATQFLGNRAAGKLLAWLYLHGCFKALRVERFANSWHLLYARSTERREEFVESEVYT
jgi:hypothetical protein